MRKFGKDSAGPSGGADRESGTGWLQNHCAIAVCIVAILAFVLRTVFVYGVSAGSDFALSGGSDAQYHLHVVESILDGSFIFGSDAAINYPIGGLNVNPPLYDMIAAAIGAISSASFALAILAPIFGALTVFPVYFIGKELGGYKIGFVAALLYGLMALPISSSVFSNGTEYAFAAFLVAIFTLAFIKVVRKVNGNELAFKEIAIAGVILGLIALSWNGFRAVFVMLIIIMVIQLVMDRFNSKDFKVPLYSYSIMMLIGIAIGAAYYIPAGLWDAVFSGPVLITIIAVAFGFIFKALESKPWIFTIPGLVAAFIIIAVVLFFAAPDYCNALIFGNSIYSNSLMEELAKVGVSISKMSAYYGWLLMWMPAMLGIYEFYKYARKERTHTKLAYTMWLLVLWFAAWTSYGTAAAMGCVFAVASAIVLVKVITKADLKAWYASMRGAGFPGFLRKMIKPLPFLSVVIAVFLVAAPCIVNAVDAGISSNEDYDYFGYGNTTYTVETNDDSYPMSYIYENLLPHISDNIAFASWIDYAADLEARGFMTVNDPTGSGASAVAQMYLAQGSAGATAAQIVRLMMANPEVSFNTAFGDFSRVGMSISDYIQSPDVAKDIVLNDSSFGNVKADITDENAVYLASIKKITDNMSTYDIMETYQKARALTGQQIGYYVLDGSMLPLMYGDGDILSTIAYFAGYTVDGYGAASQFYSLITYYSNYYPAAATDALYGTFLWKALIGNTPEDAGYSSSFSYLYDLASSNGKVKPTPGEGLAGYEIMSWYVKYNPDAHAAASDDGWEYMDYADAVAKQSKDGGIINYLSSIIVYEYVGTGSSLMTSSVANENDEPLSGITVQVKSYNDYYGKNTVYYETKTNSNGEFTVMVPEDGDYTLVFKNGSLELTATEGVNYTILSASFIGLVTLGSSLEIMEDYLYVLDSGDEKYYLQSVIGMISSASAVDEQGNSVLIKPGVYSYELRNTSAAAVASGTITLYPGENNGLMVSPTSYKVTLSATDSHGQAVSEGTFVLTNTSTGETYTTANVGSDTYIYVPSGTYTVKMEGGYVTTYSSSQSVTSSRTISLTAYESDSITVRNASELLLNAYGGGFTTTVSYGLVDLPVTIGANSTAFMIYGSDGTDVYYGQYTGASTSITLQSSKACEVTGSIGSAGTVVFVNGSMYFTATAGSDGKFSILLPSLSYVVYAYNDSNKAYLGTENITGDKDLGTLSLGDGKKITATYNYASGTSSSNVGLAFAPISLRCEIGNGTYTLPALTDTSGKATFVIPKDATGVTVTAANGSVNNSSFNASSLSKSVEDGTADASATVTIDKSGIVSQTVRAPYTMTLTPYGGGDDIKFDRSAVLAPGQYTAKIDPATGSYFNGTVYVYPGETSFTGLNVIVVYGVKIVKGDLDELTITGDKTHDNYNGDDVYYFEYDCDYYLKTYNPSTGMIRNGYLNPTKTGSVPESLDMTANARTNVITGYVGAIADGTVYFSYEGGVVVEAEVENGAFTIDIPDNITVAAVKAEVTKTIDGEVYGYFGSVSNVDLTSGVVNIPVYNNDVAVDYTSGDLQVKFNYANFVGGYADANITVYNNTDSLKTYVITAGSAWTLDGTYQIILQAGESGSITVEGTYDEKSSGIGSQGATLTVKDFNGTTSKTVHILEGGAEIDFSSVTMKTASECDNKDKLSGSEYMYALTFVNDGAATALDISASVGAGYTVVLMTENGELIKQAEDRLFVIPAKTTTVIYAKVMTMTGQMTTAPSITVSTDLGSKTLSPSTIDLEIDSMTVSGDTAVDERSGIPMGIWFIFGLSIIMLILIVWMGSKRGVFSRR